MEDLAKTATAVKDYVFPPPEKTLVEKCSDYVKDHPSTVATGVGVGVVGWYTIPIVLSAITWLPCIGAGYYVYSQTRTTQQTYSWYQWGKSWIVSEKK